jgi:TRAP-type C4-dicarboxylate transport system substrate-binding protein
LTQPYLEMLTIWIESPILVVNKKGTLGQQSSVAQVIVLNLARQDSMTQELSFAIGEQRVINEKIAPELIEIVYPTPEQSQQWEEAVASLLSAWLATAGEDGQKAVNILREYNP